MRNRLGAGPRLRWFVLAVAVQVAVLAVMIALHAYTLASGTAIMLHTEPLDPWDVTRGTYVHMRPSISDVDPALYQGNVEQLQHGDTVYVYLKPGTPYWEITAARPNRVAPAPGEVMLKAQVDYAVQRPAIVRVGLAYSFQDFYISDAHAANFQGRRSGIDLQVRVDRFGNAALERVILDGQPLPWQ